MEGQWGGLALGVCGTLVGIDCTFRVISGRGVIAAVAELNQRRRTTTVEAHPACIAPLAMSDDLMEEQFSRNKLFMGERGQNRVHRGFVVVVGLGGVGSHAAHMIARAGVERMRSA